MKLKKVLAVSLAAAMTLSLQHAAAVHPDSSAASDDADNRKCGSNHN